jgi:hypothetical protein
MVQMHKWTSSTLFHFASLAPPRDPFACAMTKLGSTWSCSLAAACVQRLALLSSSCSEATFPRSSQTEIEVGKRRISASRSAFCLSVVCPHGVPARHAQVTLQVRLLDAEEQLVEHGHLCVIVSTLGRVEFHSDVTGDDVKRVTELRRQRVQCNRLLDATGGALVVRGVIAGERSHST